MKVIAMLSLVAPALGFTQTSYNTADCSGPPSSPPTVQDDSYFGTVSGQCITGVGNNIKLTCSGDTIRYDYYTASDTTCSNVPTQDCVTAMMSSTSTTIENCFLSMTNGVCSTVFNISLFGVNIAVSQLATFTCGTASSNPCFPSSSMVTMADGTTARLDALKEGDSIVATTTDGTLTTDTVSLLSIAEPDAHAPFVVLATSANQTLTLTEAHHVPVGASCCANLKQAKDVAIGETVWAAPHGGAAVATSVVSKSYTSAAGLHSPVLTGGGFPVVDGLVTAFDTIEKVTLAKHGLGPLIKTCKATGTCETFKRLFLGDDAKYIA